MARAFPLRKAGLLLLLYLPKGSIPELIRVTRLILFLFMPQSFKENRASEKPGAVH
jgi:hypothetical protein